MKSFLFLLIFLAGPAFAEETGATREPAATESKAEAQKLSLDSDSSLSTYSENRDSGNFGLTGMNFFGPGFENGCAICNANQAALTKETNRGSAFSRGLKLRPAGSN